MNTAPFTRWPRTLAALCAALCFATGIHGLAPAAEQPAARVQSASAGTRSEAKGLAIRQAVIDGYRQAVRALGRDPDPTLEQQLAQDPDRWVIASRILETQERPGQVELKVSVELDESALRAHLAGLASTNAGGERPAAREIGDRLGRPNLVIALAPRIQGDLDAASLAEFRTVIFEQLNASLGEAFFRAGFRVVEPDWKSEELEGFRSSTAGRESVQDRIASDGAIRFRRNVRYRSQMDVNVDYALVGTLTVSARKVGDKVALTLSVAGDILTTFTESDATVPMQHNGETVGATLESAAQLSAAHIGDRLAHMQAIPLLLQEWRNRVAEGTEYRVYVFHENEDDTDSLVEFLQANGKILAIDDRDSQLMALRYVTKSLSRADLSNDRLLRIALRRMGGALPAGCQIRSIQGEIYFAPRNPRFDALLAGIGEGARYLLKDYEAKAFRHDDKPRPAPEPQPQARPQPSRPAEEPTEISLQRAVAGMAKAVGLVVIEGAEERVFFGTAWATRDRVWASNAHIAEPADEALRQGRKVFILPNLTSKKTLRVTRAQWYAQYWKGRDDADVGLLLTEESVADIVPIASRERLLELTQGEPVALLGFPRGSLPMGNVNIETPIATMQTGIISALSDGNLANVAPQQRTFIRHNLATLGGASGSPLLNRFGEVVGIHFGGPSVELTRPEDNRKLTFKEASGINYALRADLILDLMEKSGVR
ncbi:MAG: serine protease [Limisphaerales bacterium]